MHYAHEGIVYIKMQITLKVRFTLNVRNFRKNYRLYSMSRVSDIYHKDYNKSHKLKTNVDYTQCGIFQI